jgi:L-rhamnose mutarotase
MQRIAFAMRLRTGQEAEYRRRHATVWPEMLEELRAAGARNYSIFLRAQDLFAYLEVEDFERFRRPMAGSAVNEQWQREMEPLIDPLTDPATGFHSLLDVVFHLED